MITENETVLASWVDYKFKQSLVNKEPFMREWETYMKAYNGDNWYDGSIPDYKSTINTNYVFGTIETIRPIMVDNNPRFQVFPRTPEGREKSHVVDKALSYEFDRERVSKKLMDQLVVMLVYGTAVFYVGYDNKQNDINMIPINPMNIFPDPLATSIEDAEYVIYAKYMHVNTLKELFPNKAEDLIGGDISYSELVNDNDKNAATINNQVLVCEMWTRDYTSIDVEEDGASSSKRKYPNGRVITACPELGIILSDRANAFKDGRFPFILLKDYDVPFKFWGDGEVKRLLSPQQYMNELNNSIIDNAKATANMPWIIDKNSGIAKNALTNRPGLVIRKTPGSEVRREQAPSMPVYVSNKVMELKEDIEQISGVYDTLKGNSEKGVYTAQGILALQEAGQARIRMKVKNLEHALGEMACLWYKRMLQFWNGERWVRVTKNNGSPDYAKVDKDIFEFDYDISIVAGSTMAINKGAMLDLMIRLGQTIGEDGLPVVDREAVLQYIPQVDAGELMKRQKQRADKAQKQQEQQMINDEQHMKMHQQSETTDQEFGNIIKDVNAQIQELNQIITEIQQSIDEEKDLKQRDEIESNAYNAGYEDAVTEFSPDDEAMEEPDVDELPPDILNDLQDLSDEEFMELLEMHPELAEQIKAQSVNSNPVAEPGSPMGVMSGGFGTPQI